MHYTSVRNVHTISRHWQMESDNKIVSLSIKDWDLKKKGPGFSFSPPTGPSKQNPNKASQAGVCSFTWKSLSRAWRQNPFTSWYKITWTFHIMEQWWRYDVDTNSDHRALQIYRWNQSQRLNPDLHMEVLLTKCPRHSGRARYCR